jgi:hypothetical protein
MSVTTTVLPADDPAAEPTRPPFGLPPGSVRGMLSVLICGFFWILLLLPAEQQAKAVLGHYFLLGLVMMAFAQHPAAESGERAAFLPWFLRLLFVGGSVAAVAIAWARDVTVLQHRLTPDPGEVKDWWIPFLGVMAGGFAFGLFLRFLLGRENHVFRTVRAWFSVVGSVMLALEIGLFLSATAAGTGTPAMDVLHAWQCVEIAVVAAYFGTRA